MCGVRHSNNGRARRGHERIAQRSRILADWRYVVVRATFFDIELLVGANSSEHRRDGDRAPSPQRTTHALVGVRRNLLPPAELFRRALTKAHLVARVPAAFRGVAGVLAVNAGFEQNFLERHRSPFMRS